MKTRKEVRPMKAKLSILALNKYTNGSVFSRLALPNGLNHQQVIDTICMECAELSLVYPQPAIMEQMIGTWSRNKVDAWTRILTALQKQYDPLYNYDRYEQWTDKGTHDKATTDSLTAGASASGSNTSKVAGFNQSAGLADSTKDIQDTSSSSNSSSSGTDKGSTSGTHDGHIYGNIGVTTSAQMLQGEIDVRVANDICSIITQSFKNQFCIQVY